MLTLPIPLIVVLALIFLLLRALLVEKSRPWPVALLLSACILQGITISLVQHYGFTALKPWQPIGASLIPPAAYLAFIGTTQRTLHLKPDMLHIAIPAFIAFCVRFAPSTIDFAGSAIFLFYATAIFANLRKGPDNMPLARLEAGEWPAYVWRAVGLSLLLSAAIDGLISWLLSYGIAWAPPLIVSLGSSLSLLLIGALSLSQISAAGEQETIGASEAPNRTHAEDENVLARLNALLSEKNLYEDSGLTLARLARRLGIPAKQLSASINRATGDNVSRYVNGFRINAACALLGAGRSVTEAQLESGFNTKSNFNREFLRITGKTPSAWKVENRASSGLSLTFPPLNGREGTRGQVG